MVTLDIIDKKILYQLDLNSRQSISQIGRRIHFPKTNVGYRIKKLQENGVIKKFYTVIDSFKLGYTSIRFYLVYENINPDIEREIIDYFVKNKYTWWVGSIEGRFDLVIVIWIRNINEFYSFWENTLKKYRKYLSKQIFSYYTQLFHYRYSFLLDDYPKEDRTKYEITGGGKLIDFDNIDYRILKSLASNSRIPITDMMKLLGISSKTIRKRIQRLKKLGVILGYRVQIDYSKLGLQYFKLDIQLNEYSKLNSIISYVKFNPNLIFIDRSAGYADLELEFLVKNQNQLRDIVNDLVMRFPNVIKSYNNFYLTDIYKTQYIPEE